MITVEQATESDLEDICVLDRMIIGDSRRWSFLANAIKVGQCLIARVDQTSAGFAVLEQSFYGHGFLSLLIVHPMYRRQGVATALIGCVETMCPTEKLFTSTNQSNIPMQQLCEALGFVRSGWIENLDEGDPEIIYFKRVGDKMIKKK
jgi:GNAT superfamily N-acetyltransferase